MLTIDLLTPNSPKFYFFDQGVKCALDFSLDAPLASGTYGFGKAFEAFVLQELFRLNLNYRKSYQFSYLRTQAGVKIDLVIRQGQQIILVEIKSTDHVRADHLTAL